MLLLKLVLGLFKLINNFRGKSNIWNIDGAMYPIAMVTALRSIAARSVLLGLFLPGYCFGYIMAMVWYRAFAGKKVKVGDL